jgi:hypothetical protein
LDIGGDLFVVMDVAGVNWYAVGDAVREETVLRLIDRGDSPAAALHLEHVTLLQPVARRMSNDLLAAGTVQVQDVPVREHRQLDRTEGALDPVQLDAYGLGTRRS